MPFKFLRSCFALTLALLLAIMPTALAGVSGLPDGVSFYEKPKTLEFEVRNDSNYDQELSVEFYGPRSLRAEFQGSIPAILERGKGTNVRIELTPGRELIGSRFNATLSVLLGADDISKKLELSFYAVRTQPFTLSLSSERLENSGEGFRVKAVLENKLARAIRARFDGVHGTPKDWSYTRRGEEFTIAAQGRKEIEILVKAGTAFKGKASLTFEGEGAEASESIYLESEGKKEAGMLSGLAGLFAALQLPAWRLAIDLLLMVAAAVLLIAFIARLVKRLEGKREGRRK